MTTSLESPTIPGPSSHGSRPVSPHRPLLSSPMIPSSSKPPYIPPSHPGCVLCGLVASAASQTTSTGDQTPTSATFPHYEAGASQPRRFGSTKVGDKEVIYRDKDITVYTASGKERLCAEGRHLIVVINQHVESVYNLGPSDIPLLSHVMSTAEELLYALPGSSNDTETGRRSASALRIGFVGPIMRDPQLPYAHLYAHAMLGPIDTSLPGAGLWRRNIVFGSLNWWSLEDLRAEIRESTSNNRVKSGYADRARAPIDTVPDAGSRAGPPNAQLLPPRQSESSKTTPTGSRQPSLAADRDLRAASRGKQRAEPESSDRHDEPRNEHGDDTYEAVDLGSRT